MGKEKQVIGELYDVLDSLAEELWPRDPGVSRNGDAQSDDDMEEEDFEKALANELSAIKKPAANEKRLKNVFIDTKCLAFLSCRPPLDPVRLTLAYFEEIEKTGRARTRNVLRLSPVLATCVANPTEIASLAKRIMKPIFEAEPPRPYRYKIQTRIRNNTKLSSEVLIPEIAKCVPKELGHVVDLQNPEMVAVCGISVVPDWLKYKRFNVVEYVHESPPLNSVLLHEEAEMVDPEAQQTRASRPSSRFIVTSTDHPRSLTTPPTSFDAEFTMAHQEEPAETLDSMLDLMRRLPPTRIEENVLALTQLVPEVAEEFLGSVDQPLKIKMDKATGREFLICDYNRDGDSYRGVDDKDGTFPSTKLRKLEIQANDAFDSYYEGGVSSVFLWDLDDGGFAGVVLLKKNLKPQSASAASGSWDSIHVFETAERGRHAHYKLTSTIMLQMVAGKGGAGGESKKPGEWTKTAEDNVDLSGSMTRQAEADSPISDQSSHIVNVGRMIEDMEIKMRNLLQEVYFGKTRDIVFDLRSVESLEKQRRQRDLQKELVGMMNRNKAS
ncbi:F-actin-capping protein subunit beta [Tulasnella sp. 417]|nr:F-actin-capping protein subunit beta [Tulasnella sp. 417]